MARIKNPKIFSQHFDIAPSVMKKIGVFNPVLNVDTPLFMDPILLHKSLAPELKDAATAYKKHFERVLGFLKNSASVNDANWRLARELFNFGEVQGTCLGYGAGSIRGSRISALVLDEILLTASAIVNLGVDDPDVFLIAFMLQEKFGPDNLSDMVTTIILPNLAKYTARITTELKILSESFRVGTPPASYLIPVNPSQGLIRTPVYLIPRDVLRKLPIALCHMDVSDAAAESSAIRRRANLQIGGFWRAKTVADRKKQKNLILSDKNTVLAIISTLQKTVEKAYDFDGDPDGYLVWREAIFDISKKFPLIINLTKDKKSNESLKLIVNHIVSHFKDLIERNGMWSLLYYDRKGRNEKFIQKLFFIVADSYCKANNIDISPETDSGGGPVDFKFSTGYDERVLVELKLSTNSSVVAGYTKQLEVYKNASKPIESHYVVIETNRPITNAKKKVLLSEREYQISLKNNASNIWFVDGSIQKSASKR